MEGKVLSFEEVHARQAAARRTRREERLRRNRIIGDALAWLAIVIAVAMMVLAGLWAPVPGN